MCSVRMQQIHETISTKSSKIAIHENLDPRKFSAIRYMFENQTKDVYHRGYWAFTQE